MLKVALLITLLAFTTFGRALELGSITPETPSEANKVLRDIVAAGRLSDLRWPDFSDYRTHLKAFYEPSEYAVVSLLNHEPTPQAQTVIEPPQRGDSKGLTAAGSDGAPWDPRRSGLA